MATIKLGTLLLDEHSQSTFFFCFFGLLIT
jgi:hypothetical protein